MADAVVSLLVLAGVFGVLVWRVLRRRPRSSLALQLPPRRLHVVKRTSTTEALLRARLGSAEAGLVRAAEREAALTTENLQLAAQLAREARRGDDALNKLDEVAQRIRHVAPELAAEMDELNGIGRA